MRLTQVAMLSLVVLVSGIAVDAAGPHPNFSGTWELDKAHSVMPSLQGMPNVVGRGDVTLVIEHQAEMLKIERRVRFISFERSHISVYYTDGRQASNRTPRGDPITSISRWEGNTVVTELKGTVELNGKTESIQGTNVWRLSQDGKVLSVESTLKKTGDDHSETARLVFVKKATKPQ